jgi:hypothetical protein
LTPRNNRTRATRDALAQDLAAAVLHAVQSAVFTALRDLAGLADTATTPRRAAAVAPVAPVAAPAVDAPAVATPKVTRVAAARSDRKAPRRAHAPRSAPVETIEEHTDVEIVDPSALLDWLDPTPSVREPATTVRTTLLADVPPRNDVATVEPPPVAHRELLARPGEQVLRASGGGAVLRRRRVNAADAPE